MYVLENVRDFVQLHNMQAGSTLSFYYAPDNRLVASLLAALSCGVWCQDFDSNLVLKPLCHQDEQTPSKASEYWSISCHNMP